ncbi:AAA family ATPase (plasmid) [Spiroplasma citri]|nr:AAA family ATPase [Spiroplasma citri]
MKIITVGALKGGVGKTNFTFNLSCFLAIEKRNEYL